MPTKGVSELIEYLLERIALCGEQGKTISHNLICCFRSKPGNKEHHCGMAL
jgi:hypothetical protein